MNGSFTTISVNHDRAIPGHPGCPILARVASPMRGNGARDRLACVWGRDCGAWEIRVGMDTPVRAQLRGGVTNHAQGLRSAHLGWDAQVQGHVTQCRVMRWESGVVPPMCMATTEEVPGVPKYRRAWAAGRLNTNIYRTSLAAARAAPQPGRLRRNAKPRGDWPARGLVLARRVPRQ